MIITKERVKIEIGTTETTYDDRIAATIPNAESKFRQIAGFGFSVDFYADYTSTENTFLLPVEPNSIIYKLRYGNLIDGVGVPSETYITDINTTTGIVTVSNAFTSDGTKLVLCQDISYWSTISQMIMYLISKKTATAGTAKEVTRKSVGPLSVTYDKSAISSKWGIPESIVNSIPVYGSLS